MEQIWMCGRVATSLLRVDFLDPALSDQDDARERGVRVEIRVVDSRAGATIYASPTKVLRPAVCRIDLLESAVYAADRMHWHPAMKSGEPGERTFEVEMRQDPLRWLEDRLRHVDTLLTGAGVVLDAGLSEDVETVRRVVPDIIVAAARALEWARSEPWPTVERDDHGLARTH